MSVQESEFSDGPVFSKALLTLINCTPAELVYVAARAGYDAESPHSIATNVSGEFTDSPHGRVHSHRSLHGDDGRGGRLLGMSLGGGSDWAIWTCWHHFPHSHASEKSRRL